MKTYQKVLLGISIFVAFCISTGFITQVGKDWLISGATITNCTFTTPMKMGTASYTPPAADGSAGYLLKTNGSGVMSWVDPPVKVATVTLDADQLKALYTTAIEVVPAPGTHETIQVLGCSLFYNYSGGACTIGSATNLALKYKDKSGTACSGTLAVTGFLDQTVDMSATLIPAAVGASAVAINEHLPVCLTLAGADVTGASVTSTVTCKVIYVVQATGF